MINTLRKWIFGEEQKAEEVKEPEQEHDYICLRLDPLNTINKLEPNNPNWNMQKVQEGLMSGMLRYATKQEVEDAIRDGRVKS